MATNLHQNGNGLMRPVHRVVITGMGAITPLALTMGETWDALLAGRSGIGPITHFDASELKTRFAGQVKDFDPENYMDRKEARRTDPFIQFAVAASREAVADSGVDFSAEQSNRCGILYGSAIGGLHTTLENQELANQRGMSRVSPFMIPNMLIDSAPGKIAIEYNLHGPNHAVVSACASGSSVCGEAFELLRRGDADVMLVGGGDAALSPIIFAGFDVMGALSRRNDDPATACRPFDVSRDGFVMSEGSAMMVMETEEHAKARSPHLCRGNRLWQQRRCLQHGRTPRKWTRAVDAMSMALRKAGELGVTPEQVDYINAHGTATRLNDVAETLAIKQVFGEHAYNVNISSTKSMTGHLLGGAGAIETMICAKVISESIIPPTINLIDQDPECDLHYTPLVPKKAEVMVTLSNSFGFGGHNACVMLRKYA
ncbi:MAG: beta-ketoacyl-ACP synthase II [Caldilineaceae bacterium]